MTKTRVAAVPDAGAALGSVAELWRYPVKSLQGQRCESVKVTTRGLAGDREYALVHADGRLASGKTTRRFRQVDGLLDLQAALDEEGELAIGFPDGQHHAAGALGLTRALRNSFGADVALRGETDRAHFDDGPVHLLTSASLAWLAKRLPAVDIEARRFRPNIVLDVPGEGLVEQQWPGAVLHLGASVRLRITTATSRCRMVTLPQPGLAAGQPVLQRLVAEAGGDFGVYAEVLTTGELRCGDEVRLLAQPGSSH